MQRVKHTELFFDSTPWAASPYHLLSMVPPLDLVRVHALDGVYIIAPIYPSDLHPDDSLTRITSAVPHLIFLKGAVVK